MPWDESVTVTVELGVDSTVSTVDGPAGRQVQQPRFAADGTRWDVCDEGGWLNVRRNGRAVLAEPHEHAGPSWGPGQRSYAVSPDGRYVVLNRNEDGFGRLVLVDVDSTERIFTKPANERTEAYVTGRFG